MIAPNSDDQLLVREIKDKIIWEVKLRYAIVGLGLLLILFSMISRFHLGIFPSLVIFIGAYNTAAFAIYLMSKQTRLWWLVSFRLFSQLFDVVTITYLIYFTGSLESPFWFLYLVMIIISGYGIYSFYASLNVFLIAFFSNFFYLGLLFLTYLGIIPTYGATFTLTPQQMLYSILNKAVFTTVSFFLFAATIYYFSKLLTQHRQELVQKNKELVVALDELRETDRLKDEFVSSASHELRTPLAIIRENISLIEDGIIGAVNEKQRGLLASSRENVDRLANIINTLLDLSRIESRSFDLDRQPADVGELAGKAVALLQDKARQKQMTIDHKTAGNLVALIDQEQVLRVMINLIDNAIKYTPENGEIAVTTERIGNDVMVAVQDTGKGIAEKDLHRVFGRFMRFNAKDEESKGWGLGLFICKGLIEMHGGKIWVESRVGRGSRFIFTLPGG